MRVLLRNRATKLYAGPDPETWVIRDQARDYKHTSLAIQAAQELHPKTNLEVLLTFDDPRFDISLPLHL
jgi:hypothetical protein